ncbi:unnamed protein product [Heterobilharzia americana]|nr:unnamed protein product [Heterobilharzia americana]
MNEPVDRDKLKEDVRCGAKHTENQFTWEPILQSKMAGHTGYLTFATWMPSLQNSISTTESAESTQSVD